EHRVAGGFHVALFRGLRRGDRLAHHRDRGRYLRRFHRAGTDHADAADPERHERVVRHLLSQVQGTIYEILSAPVSYLEIVIGYVGAAATKSIILGLVVLATSGLLIPLRIAHPVWMIAFLVLTAVSFSLFGFILGLWADGFEKLQVVPLLI